MCERCQSGNGDHTNRVAKPGRLKLWEFPDNAHCPVVGTCLSHDDLLRITRSLRLSFDRTARDYDVHGYFVQSATKDTPEARAMTKLLDERHQGALRQLRRLQCGDDLSKLWERMKADGRIAAGFWAFMTSSHVPAPLRSQIFGEVHMLSHLMGASHRNQSAQTASLRQQLDGVIARRERSEAQHRASLEERDRVIDALKADIETLRRALAAKRASTARTADPERPSAKVERALDIARGRARAAEAQAERLKAERDALRRKIASPRRSEADRHISVASSAPNRLSERLTGRNFLYVGGRNAQQPHLRRVAETFGAELHHHDGGMEDAMSRLDAVLPSVDCVFCPIDCISHDACLRAKQGCKKYGKSFVPLRSASKACLRHALLALVDEASGAAASTEQTPAQKPG